MKASIVERNPQSWLGYHLQGPWQETVPRGFNQLKSWVEQHGMTGEWLAIYYGNPEVLPPEELRVETVITAPADAVPSYGDDIEQGLLPGGPYFHARMEVMNNDFFTAGTACLITSRRRPTGRWITALASNTTFPTAPTVATGWWTCTFQCVQPTNIISALPQCFIRENKM
nr:GyrI-like domain-containing protein [Pantoea sp. SM3]